MEDLRTYLESKPATKRASDGQFVWQCLKKKLIELRKNHINTSEPPLTTLSLLSNDQLMNALVDIEKCKFPDGDRAVVMCVEVLRRCALNCVLPHVFVQSHMMPLVDVFISTLAKLFQTHRFATAFLREFLKFEGVCPVQLLWRLQKAGILQISTYACQYGKLTGKSSHLPASVLWLLTHPTQSQSYTNMGRDILASLLVTSQGGVPGVRQDLSSSSVLLLQQFTELIVKWALKLHSNDCETSFHLTYLSSPELCEACGQDAVKWFALTHLLQLLLEDTSCSSMSTFCDAAHNQEKNWTFESSPMCLRDLLLMIVSILKAEEIVRHLAGAVVKPYANWKVILLTTTILITTFPESGDHFKGLTEELLRIGLEGGRQVELSAAFLLARQCCNSRCQNFLSYASWFSSHFGPDSTTARSPVQFQSLLQVLTELAPAETADTLRVHLNKVPQAPTNCHALLHDYTVLARTRLADLNESTELAGLFGNNRQDTLSGLELRLSDLSKVLEHFQRTGEVMKPVFEAAIFRPQYYRDVFLPDLLGLSETNCRFNENFKLENVRHDFISILKPMNKIPDKLFREYLQKKHPVPSESSNNIRTDEKINSDISKGEVKPELKKKKSLQVKLKKQ